MHGGRLPVGNSLLCEVQVLRYLMTPEFLAGLSLFCVAGFRLTVLLQRERLSLSLCAAWRMLSKFPDSVIAGRDSLLRFNSYWPYAMARIKRFIYCLLAACPQACSLHVYLSHYTIAHIQLVGDRSELARRRSLLLSTSLQRCDAIFHFEACCG